MMQIHGAKSPLLILMLCAWACGDDVTDLGRRDAGFPDSGAEADAGADDAGPVDAGPADSGVQPDAGDSPQSIVFLHTNDEHSHLLGFAPNLDDFPVPSTRPSIKGGVSRRAAVLDSLRVEAVRAPYESPVVTVNAGDVSMGSLFHLGNLVSSPDYILQGLLRYDVMTLGGHEFDFGPTFLARMIGLGTLNPLDMSVSPLQIPLVTSNIRFSMSSLADNGLAAFYGGNRNQPIQRTFIREYGDVTVGFVGVMGLNAALLAATKEPITFSLAVDESNTCTENADCPRSICIPPADNPLSSVGSCALDPSGFDAEVNFPALISDVTSAVRELRLAGAEVVVALSHSGIDEREVETLRMMGLGLENATRSEDVLLARGVDQALSTVGLRGLDLIVGGHSHTALLEPLVVPNDNSGSNTYIVQAGSYGQYIGKVRLTRESQTDDWSLDTDYSELVALDGTVDVSSLSPISALIIDQVFDTLIDSLEQLPLANPEDGLVLPGEQCDVTADGDPVGATACDEIIEGASGDLGCHENRQLDLSQCTLPAGTTCGDGNIEGAEQCDGDNVPSCADLGYVGGALGCANNCTVDTSNCTIRFPSLLEAALNFALPPGTPPILFDPATSEQGELFFATIGATTFDLGDQIPNNESNLSNLVADANRQVSNLLVPEFETDPIRVSLVSNGVIQDGIFQGETGVLSFADLFRVLPFGLSPQENTPGHSLVDFWLNPTELKTTMELGLSQGFRSNAFWLSISGAQVEYDLSLPPFDPENPTTTGQITRIRLVETTTIAPWTDTNATYEETDLFNRTDGFADPNRLLHVSTNFYNALYLTNFGICPRVDGVDGEPFPQCKTCTSNDECPAAGTQCDTTAGVCTGGSPIPFFARTTVAFGNTGFAQELKEFLALTSYIRRMPNGGTIPEAYNGSVPRRMCCVGTMCPADGSRTCP